MTRHDGYEERFADLAVLAYRTAFRLTGDRQESEDFAQEALTRAYVRWSRIRDYDEAWIVQVTTNLAIGRWRRARYRTQRARALAAEAASPAAVDRTAERLALVEALCALPRRQREVAVLRFVGDLSIDDTARALGCSIGTVKQHSARALAALRGSVGDEEVEPDTTTVALDTRRNPGV